MATNTNDIFPYNIWSCLMRLTSYKTEKVDQNPFVRKGRYYEINPSYLKNIVEASIGRNPNKQQLVCLIKQIFNIFSDYSQVIGQGVRRERFLEVILSLFASNITIKEQDETRQFLRRVYQMVNMNRYDYDHRTPTDEEVQSRIPMSFRKGHDTDFLIPRKAQLLNILFALQQKCQQKNLSIPTPPLLCVFWNEKLHHKWCTSLQKECVFAILGSELRLYLEEKESLVFLPHELWQLILTFLPVRILHY